MQTKQILGHYDKRKRCMERVAHTIQKRVILRYVNKKPAHRFTLVHYDSFSHKTNTIDFRFRIGEKQV